MDNYLKLKENVDRYLNNSEKKKDIINYLVSLKHFNSIEDWQNIIKLLFYIDEIRNESIDKIFDLIAIAQNKFGTSEVNDLLFFYLKEESDVTKDFSTFFYVLHQKHKYQQEELFNYEDVKDATNSRLKRYINEGNNITIAFTLFYSCWDRVDEKNIVHITTTALQLMRKFVDKVPEDYLNFIIRPKYMPADRKMDGDYYSFVFEPYTENIFENWVGFRKFLENCKGVVDQNVLDGINKLLTEYAHNTYKYIPIQENEIDKYGSLIRKWLPIK